MSRVGENLPDVKNPLSLVQYLAAVQRVVDQEIQFGSPITPYEETAAAPPLAGDMTATRPHNGELLNIAGSWVEVNITDPNDIFPTGLVTCTHNLNLPTFGAGVLNTSWLVMGWQHDGTAYASPPQTIFRSDGLSTVTADSVELGFAYGGTVSGDHPLRCTLFFPR